MRTRLGLVAGSLGIGGLALLALPATALAAGNGTPPPGATVHVQLWQAVLIALGYYLANSPWLFGLAYYTFLRPLVAGLFVGIILGDPAQGTLIGAAINLAYLGFISAGGSLPGDPALAGWVGVAVALAGNLTPAQAVALAVPIGLLGFLIFTLRMTVSSVFAHWADDRAEAADISGVALMNWLPGQAFLFAICFFPVLLLALNGADYVINILSKLPFWVLNGLTIAGTMLPAIGIALNMRFIFRGAAIPYFFLGYLIFVVTGGGTPVVIGVAVLGVVLAALHLYLRRDEVRRVESSRPAATTERPVAATAGDGAISLTRRDVIRSWITWTFFSHANYNYERLQGTGFAHAMTPIIRKLYRTEDEIRDALKRHLVFFNTEPNLGNLIQGTVIAMEEQRANGAPIDDDAINSVKSGLMGPLAGIGDTLSQGTLTPLFLGIGIGIAGASSASAQDITGRTGNPLGAIVYIALISVSILAIGYAAWMIGYVRGREVVIDILRSGAIDRLIVGASVVGNIVLGALAGSYILNSSGTPVVPAPALPLARGTVDTVASWILPLALVLFTWWLLRRRMNPLILMVVYLGAALVLAYPFFGDPNACTSSILHVGSCAAAAGH